jgi:hypothetical protein
VVLTRDALSDTALLIRSEGSIREITGFLRSLLLSFGSLLRTDDLLGDRDETTRQHRVIQNVGHNLPQQNLTAFAAGGLGTRIEKNDEVC